MIGFSYGSSITLRLANQMQNFNGLGLIAPTFAPKKVTVFNILIIPFIEEK